MSPLVVLGTVGTLVSTITIVPHVLHATRNKQPSGSPLAWVMGTAGSTIWLLYGLAAGDLLVAAPGLVTIPCGLLLAIWSLRGRRETRVEPDVSVPVFVPDEWLGGSISGDTREMPAVA